jgi:ADP-ribose pyrophosphatase
MAEQIKRPSASKSSSSTAAGRRPITKSRLISSKIAYKGKVFSVISEKVEEANGTINTRDVIRHNGSVVILAVDESKNPRDPDIIFERQYRHATGQILIELPAGRVEPGEASLAAAKRELIEETGYRAKRWGLLSRYYASPGFLGEFMQIYLARDIREGVATPEPDEHIEVFRLRLSEAMALVEANKIQDGKTLIGLMIYDKLRRKRRP